MGEAVIVSHLVVRRSVNRPSLEAAAIRLSVTPQEEIDGTRLLEARVTTSVAHSHQQLEAAIVIQIAEAIA